MRVSPLGAAGMPWCRSRLWHGEGAAKPGFKDHWVVRTLRVLDSVLGVGRGGRGRAAPKLAAFEPRRHALPVQSCNFMVRIGDMRGLLTRPVHGGNHCATDGEEQGERGSVQGECTGRVYRESAGKEMQGEGGLASRCTCQRQLKPPGGTPRSNVGVAGSCSVLPMCSQTLSRAGAPWGWGIVAPPAKR